MCVDWRNLITFRFTTNFMREGEDFRAELSFSFFFFFGAQTNFVEVHNEGIFMDSSIRRLSRLAAEDSSRLLFEE